MFFSADYLLLVMLPALIISGLAQWFVRSAYATWSQRPNSANMTGAQTAQQIMKAYGLRVQLAETPQELGDHFDPGKELVALSTKVSRQPSIASMAIAAHEFGHVQQYAEKSPLITVRSFLLPVAQIGSNMAYILIIAGLLLNFFELALLGLLLFGAGVMFTVLTLPVEIDASRRAMKMLDGMGVMRTEGDRVGVQRVLTAAALTYVAALVVALLNLAYYASLVLGRRD